MSEVMRRLAALPPDRRAAFLRKLQGQEPAAAEPVLEPGPPDDDSFPLTIQQEQLWILDRYAPGLPTYNVPLRIGLRGELDPAVLAGALRRIQARHDVLRTEIRQDGERPVQRVVDVVPLELPLEDLSGLPDPTRGQELERICLEEARRPFDLGRAPLLRCRLLRLCADEHVLLWVTHHVVFDGWSNAVLLRELCARYREEAGDRPAAADAPSLRYGDYARWQRAWLAHESSRRNLEHWTSRLAGCEQLMLPTDRPYPPRLTFDGTVETRWLPRDFLERVEWFASARNLTVFTTFLAAVQAVLHRSTGQTDLVIGSAFSNRQRASLQDLIGYFVNVVPLRCDLSGDPTFAELLERARDAVVLGLEHQELPLERIVEAVRPPRVANRLPLVQATLTMQTVQDAGAGLEMPRGLEVSSISVPAGVSRFDLALEVGRDRRGHPYLNAEYNTRIFERDTIARLLEHVEVLLAGAMADPERRLPRLEIMAPEELRAVLHGGNPSTVPRTPRTIVELFHEQVERSPQRVCVTGHGELTYRQLADQARSIASRLVGRGAAPERRVGLCLDRSPAMVAALLGVLESGAAYVPVDPAYPPERQATILRDAGAIAVVTTAALRDRVPAGPWHTVVLDDQPAADAAGPPLPPRPDNLAYVLYTSGSTGVPKGVLIEHRSVASFISTVREMFRLTPDDRILGFAPLTFDVSVFETFAALLTGARLVLCDESDRRDPERLAELMETHAVTVMDLPPAVMALLEPSRFPALRVAFVGGEAFSGQLTTRWSARGREFYNGYGPTETTVTVIAKRCEGSWEQSPPIGRAMANHRALVLDEHLAPVPMGVAGELFVGGAGMARGYLDQPALTAVSFIPDPFAPRAGERLYRTGDLARWLVGGELEFLGRVDRQVQLRGLRIELGEVESALAAHPAVRQAVVEMVGQGEQARLVAYVTGDGGQVPAEDLRRSAAAKLPAYMVPNQVLWLERIALTSSGKVDRSRLPEAAEPVARAGRPPGTELERRIADEVFAPVLGGDRPAADDNLFVIGGTSLQAMEILGRARSLFEVRIDAGEFYVEPTVARLAALVEASRVDGERRRPSFEELAERLQALPEDDAQELLRSLEGG